MRIAQVAPLAESVPPKYYGGTERIVSFITEELVRRGHDVTLFASGDSTTAATLVAACPEALRLRECVLPEVHHVLMLEQVFEDPYRFDLIHFHIDTLQYPLATRCDVPYVTTLHGRLDLPDLVPLYERYAHVPLVSISDNQREPLQWVNWQRTIYHGLPQDLLGFHEAPGTYLAFIGRISPEKRVDRAIEIARRTGMPLKIAAKVDPVDQEYFEQEIEPLLEAAHVEFIGEIGESEKEAFLGGAYALLFPIDWPEPFGLVMIESMACGTPIVAYRHGSVPEVMRDGVSGFVVDTIDEAVQAVEQIADVSRAGCRRYFEERFSVEKMVGGYIDVYEQLIAQRHLASASNGTRQHALPVAWPSSRQQRS